MVELTPFEKKYLAKANGIGFVFLACHLPVLCAVAAYTGKGVGLAAGVSLLLLAGPAALLAFQRESELASTALGVAAMGFSALAIHLSGGMIEAHFHIFTMIALLTIFGRLTPILAAAVTIALHHVVFWLWLPASVFNYQATFGIVLLHAFFVVFEVGPACFIARQFGKNLKASGIVDGKLAIATEQIGAASRQLRVAGESLAQAATEQAATFEETAASSTEIKTIAHQNEQVSSDALKAIETVNQQMLRANDQMESVRSTVAGIVESSQEIGKVIKLIDEIAFQTNILSLNASIEAARAGEFGQGFAVVADEVRGLAQRSATAATDTAALIERALGKSQDGQKAITHLDAAMRDVTETAKAAGQQMAQIQYASMEQTRSADQIERSLSQLDQISQNTAANAEEAAASGTELNVQTETLEQIVTMLREL